MATVTDPVCGMEVNSSSAPAQSSFAGKEYFFCSVECRALFDQNPGAYVASDAEPVDAPSPQQ